MPITIDTPATKRWLQICTDPAFADRPERSLPEVSALAVSEAEQFFAEEAALWGKVIHDANISIE